MKRRDFITTAAGATGYSMFIKVDALADPQDKRSADDIRKEYVPRYFVRLTPSVKTEERFYFVGGEVKIPNRQVYWGDMTVMRAIDTARRFTDFADRTKIELRRANGQKVIVNWKKVGQDLKLDPPVYPNDQITVPKRRPLF